VCRYAPQQLSTFALNLYRYRTKRGDRSVLIDFWDTAGQERFNSMHRCRNYYTSGTQQDRIGSIVYTGAETSIERVQERPPVLLGHSRTGEVQQYTQVQKLL
jgi:hypothetical protein